MIRKKAVKYVGVTAEQEIAGEDHLFVEVYKNSAENVTMPVVRIVLTAKDFGTYFPDRGEWSGVKLDNGDLLWEKLDGQRRTWDEWKKKEERNVLQSPEDMKRLKKLYNFPYDVRSERWWEYICKRQNSIALKKSQRADERKRKRRQDALNDRITHTPELPERRSLKGRISCILAISTTCIIKNHGSWVKIACSNCGVWRTNGGKEVYPMKASIRDI